MTWTTDNRYAAGASGATAPEGSTAAYSARWIDHVGTADIVPDRQGFAYTSIEDREDLVSRLTKHNANGMQRELHRDETTTVFDDGEMVVVMRRAGGYIYVDAWLVQA